VYSARNVLLSFKRLKQLPFLEKCPSERNATTDIGASR
jgi:hypothetical protein